MWTVINKNFIDIKLDAENIPVLDFCKNFSKKPFVKV